jgi:hypothetical protein
MDFVCHIGSARKHQFEFPMNCKFHPSAGHRLRILLRDDHLASLHEVVLHALINRITHLFW